VAFILTVLIWLNGVKESSFVDVSCR
jgi:hypothetical protein